MIEINSFAIHVTYTCPLECAHCCFSSSPRNKDMLDIDLINDAIQSFSGSNIKMIAFTGGEPFLLGRKLVLAVAAAKKIGVTTRIVTSAHWATTLDTAISRLTALKENGLDELSVSWDDFHEKFVNFSNIKNAYTAAKQLGIQVAISVVQAEFSQWSAARVRVELGLDSSSTDVIVESPLNLTGRASEELLDAGLRPVRSLGPCPYVITGPTLNAKNKLLACCGVIPETDSLVIDHFPTGNSIQKSIEDAQNSVLLNWLYLRGPYSIMQWIGNRYGEEIPEDTQLGGNCEACSRLFSTPKIVRRLQGALEENSAAISDEIFVLQQLNLLTGGAVLKLWKDGESYLDNNLP